MSTCLHDFSLLQLLTLFDYNLFLSSTNEQSTLMCLGYHLYEYLKKLYLVSYATSGSHILQSDLLILRYHIECFALQKRLLNCYQNFHRSWSNNHAHHLKC
mgnify:CR=1 FL=1